MVHIVPTVMISFSSANAQEADCVEEALGGVGIRLIRYESDLRPQQRIDAFLNLYPSSDAMIILLSDKYFESNICMVELAIATTIPEQKAYLIDASTNSESDILAKAATSTATSIHMAVKSG